MAGPGKQDAVPPESVLLQQFAGLKNTVSAERLAPGELEIALNIDIDDVGQPRRRRGTQLVAAGNWHSIFTTESGRVVGVRNGVLGEILPDFSFNSFGYFCGDALLAWEQIGERLFFSSDFVSGIVNGDEVSVWGQIGGAGIWLSPVVNPTATLAPIRGKLLGKPPMATALAYWNGRMYLANGKTLWATELYLYEVVDRTKNFMQFESDITAIAAVTDGIYVGTQTGIFFLSGNSFDKLARISVGAYGCAPRSMVKAIPDGLPNQKTVSRAAILCMTDQGLCVGYDAGVFSIMTDDNVWFPKFESVAAMVRKQDGYQSYIGVADSGGSPTSSARIGDYVEAEIRRFQGA